ncbi:ABC transporter ATP-binding protein [Anoxynatronum buryatiense]|uniref:Peptide/nickel transport system ATP-binding protein n=1 Tax=Anoxynatronum buryatiense TaxID=489973 RepID=A0AA46AJQ5_9CLOT|nr:ABC transporter ATP-binding protein [Anoxynatronum buryatiense]SMP62564.1 peptide/nickel transport system ATP-binding protein [Anoxynatronum buryatiense]
MKLLRVENLKTYFHISEGIVKAVDDVSFSLDDGQCLGLVGESGCGKTTTALSINRLLPPEGIIEGGEIYLESVKLTVLSDVEIRKHRWKDVSMVFQGAMNAMNPVMKIGEQIAEAVVWHQQVTHQQAWNRAKELFELVELEPGRIGGYPHEFSGGMKQRAMIAMALACDPKLVIGDEPTTALDVMVQAQILNLLDRLRKTLKMGLIIITHDLSILGETCDRIAVMYAGKIVEIGSTEDVYDRHMHPYTHRLLMGFPNIHRPKLMPEPIPGSPPDLIRPPSGCRFHPRCDYAQEICQEQEPGMTTAGNGHSYACHFGGAFNG